MVSGTFTIAHSAFAIRLSLHPHPMFHASASLPNEPTFLRSDSMVALFINPCRYATYLDSPPAKRPSRKKRYFQTNLTIGGIGNIGRVARAPQIVAEVGDTMAGWPTSFSRWGRR